MICGNDSTLPSEPMEVCSEISAIEAQSGKSRCPFLLSLFLDLFQRCFIVLIRYGKTGANKTSAHFSEKQQQQQQQE